MALIELLEISHLRARAQACKLQTAEDAIYCKSQRPLCMTPPLAARLHEYPTGTGAQLSQTFMARGMR